MEAPEPPQAAEEDGDFGYKLFPDRHKAPQQSLSLSILQDHNRCRMRLQLALETSACRAGGRGGGALSGQAPPSECVQREEGGRSGALATALQLLEPAVASPGCPRGRATPPPPHILGEAWWQQAGWKYKRTSDPSSADRF